MIEGALILLAGILIGRFLPGRRRRPKPPMPVKPICGCEHSVGFHADGVGPCAWVGEKRYRSGVGAFTPRCTCLKYVGPIPMPELFAQEIGG